MILHINTQNQKSVTVSIKENGRIIEQLTASNFYGSQVLLPLIIKLLQKAHLSLNQINKIEVATGPGSFIGLRVGAAVANALGFALGITVNGKKAETALKY